MRIATKTAICLFLSLFASSSLAQPMVVYSVGSDLYIGTGEPGSFVAANQGDVTIGDVAIDPETRAIYYIDTSSNTIGVADSSGTPLGLLSTGAVSPFVLRVSQGVVYYSDTGQTPNIRTINIATGVQGSIPLADTADDFVIDAKNSKLIYTNISGTNEQLKSANLDGSGIVSHFRPSTTTTSLEIYGDSLLRADSGTSGRISLLGLTNLSGTQTTVRVNGTGNGIPHDMASDFANNVYYYVDTGTTTGGLYRRTINGTGSAEQTKIASFSGAGGLDVLESESVPLTPNTVISSPPALVSKTAKSVTIQLREFTEVALSARRALHARRNGSRARSNATFRYEVRVTSADSGRVVKRITTKKSLLTISNLRPGSYNADYRATIYSKKTAAQKQKARAAGKKGLALNFKKRGSTNFSPPLAFELP